jgi:hypothetical protein
VLEAWHVDARIDPGADEHYHVPLPGNPGSFAEKFEAMRQRTFPVDRIEARLTHAREELAAAIAASDAGDES